ncbi:MAG: sensor histidine kinase [Bacteroidota bacterium]
MSSLQKALFVLVGATIFMALLALVGWYSDSMLLASLSPAYIPMAPFSAITFLLVSGAVILLQVLPRQKLVRWLLILLIALFALDVFLAFTGLNAMNLEAMMGFESGQFGLVPLGRMSPITAGLFLLCCSSLLAMGFSHRYLKVFTGITSSLAFLITLTVIVGYAYDTPLLYGDTIIPIALSTAMGFLFLTLALFICNGAGYFPLNLFIGNATHVRLLRTFLPLTAFLILASGGFQIFMRRRLFTNEALIISVVAIAAMVVVAVVTIYLSRLISLRLYQAEQEKDRLTDIIEATTDQVLVCDAAGTPMYLNAACLRFFSIRESQRLEQVDFRKFLANESQLHIYNNGLAYARETGSWRGEVEVSADSHNLRSISMVILYHRGCSEGENYYALVMRDISALKESQQRIEETNRQLRLKQAEMEEFVYSVSHDLNEPVRMVSGFLGLTQKKLEGKLDEETTQFMAFAIDGAQRISYMIRDLLEYSRTGVAPNEWSNGSLREIIEQALQNVSVTINETNAQVTLPVNDVQVRGDRSLLVRLFQNLVANAIKYRSAANPAITITCTDDAGRWLVAVKDNGMGIAAEYHKSIFTIFKRVPTREVKSGSGIGLATCKKIVEGHGGTIWVESEVGKGSTFYFTLPKG